MQKLLSFGLFACAATCGSLARAEPVACTASTLQQEARRAKTWRYSWTAINGGLTAGAFALVPLVSREDRPDFIVSGIGSGITVLATWFLPLRVESAAEELEALAPAKRAQQLQRLLRESAADQRDRIRWPWHLANIGFAVAGGAVIAFGYRHYVSGALTAAAGSAIGELQLLTQPTGLLSHCTSGLSLRPHLAFTPKSSAATSSWTVSVAGSF